MEHRHGWTDKGQAIAAPGGNEKGTQQSKALEAPGGNEKRSDQSEESPVAPIRPSVPKPFPFLVSLSHLPNFDFSCNCESNQWLPKDLMCQMSVMSRVSNHSWSLYLEVDERGDIVLEIPFHPKATKLWMVEGNFLCIQQKTLSVLSPWFIPFGNVYVRLHSVKWW